MRVGAWVRVGDRVRLGARVMDLVGGSSTCAQSPWKEMRMNEEGEEEEEEGASQ